MKLNKIFAVALAALTLSACSDSDNDINTASGVTVGMEQDSMSVPEDYTAGQFYNIPVAVTGETNGAVNITVEVTEFGENPAAEAENYLVTSKTITIPAGQNIGYIEFYPISNSDINDDRTFAVTIVKAEGAEIANNATCIVTLMDEDRFLPEAYEKIQGEWILGDADAQWDVTLTGYTEGEEGYLTDLVMSGIQGYEDITLNVKFTFNAATMQASVIFPYGDIVAEGVRFNSLGVCDVMFASVSDGYLVSSGSVIGVANTEYTVIELPKSAAFVGALFLSSDGSFTGNVWWWMEEMFMKRP